MHWSQKPQPACEDEAPLQCPVLDLHCMQIDSCRECNGLSRWGVRCFCLLFYWAGTGLRAHPQMVTLPCTSLYTDYVHPCCSPTHTPPPPQPGLHCRLHVKAENLRLGQLKRLTYHIRIHSQKKESATCYHRQHDCIADVPQGHICSSDETYAQHQPATAQLQQ